VGIPNSAVVKRPLNRRNSLREPAMKIDINRKLAISVAAALSLTVPLALGVTPSQAARAPVHHHRHSHSVLTEPNRYNGYGYGQASDQDPGASRVYRAPGASNLDPCGDVCLEGP
jgi:hypothetical protein